MNPTFKTFVILMESFKDAQRKFSSEYNHDVVKEYIKNFRELVNGHKVSGEEKDITFWIRKGWGPFKQFVDNAKSSPDLSRKGAKRRVKAGSDQILTLKKTDEVHLFIPLSKNASCFYGFRGDESDESSGWCISTVDGKNYFYDYVMRRGLLVFFLLYNKDVYCLVLDNDGEVLECQDKLNNNTFPVKKFEHFSGMPVAKMVNFAEKHKNRISAEIGEHEAAEYRISVAKGKRLLDPLVTLIKSEDLDAVYRFLEKNMQKIPDDDALGAIEFGLTELRTHAKENKLFVIDAIIGACQWYITASGDRLKQNFETFVGWFVKDHDINMAIKLLHKNHTVDGGELLIRIRDQVIYDPALKAILTDESVLILQLENED